MRSLRLRGAVITDQNRRDASGDAKEALRKLNYDVTHFYLMSSPLDLQMVLSSAVLHFARDEDHWFAMVKEMWRVLKEGGIFFARLSSTVGIQNQIQHLRGRIFRLPGGNEWFLVDPEMLSEITTMLGGDWIEPFKTVVVHNKRSMSNWCLRKVSTTSR